jgi:hypothetical protein
MPAVIVLPVARAAVARRYAMVVLGMLLVAIDHCGSVIGAAMIGQRLRHGRTRRSARTGRVGGRWALVGDGRWWAMGGWGRPMCLPTVAADR